MVRVSRSSGAVATSGPKTIPLPSIPGSRTSMRRAGIAGLSVLRREAARVPLQHAARQVADVAEPGLAKDGAGGRRARARPADDDQLAPEIPGQLGEAALEDVERDVQRPRDVPQLAHELLRLAHVEQ